MMLETKNSSGVEHHQDQCASNEGKATEERLWEKIMTIPPTQLSIIIVVSALTTFAAGGY